MGTSMLRLCNSTPISMCITLSQMLNRPSSTELAPSKSPSLPVLLKDKAEEKAEVPVVVNTKDLPTKAEVPEGSVVAAVATVAQATVVAVAEVVSTKSELEPAHLSNP